MLVKGDNRRWLRTWGDDELPWIANKTEDKDLKKKQTKRCSDAFLNNLCLDVGGEEGDDFAIPKIEYIDGDGDLNEDDVVENEDPFDLNREGSRPDKEVSTEMDKKSKLEFEYNTHDPKVKCNKMRPFMEEGYESPHQLKLCLTNHAIYTGYKIKFKKCDSVRLVVETNVHSTQHPIQETQEETQTIAVTEEEGNVYTQYEHDQSDEEDDGIEDT
ncbi:unnamed protein product [Lactuca virosa]|uniref:Transposase MuDR plant domain-containing protein n=1 Tax=Lactuca virosa TaxID=75947 RepID=A0AAU9MDU0_9ASTR|nr:unnamed protein product [Lactuca virosa]